MSGHETERFVITADTRRRWSREEKRAIVAEAARTTTSVSAVARRHGLAPSLLFRWRREFAEADETGEPAATPAFIPVVPLGLPATVPVAGSAGHEPEPDRGAPGRCRGGGRTGMMEIVLAGGRVIRVDGTVNATVLRRVVDALEDR